MDDMRREDYPFATAANTKLRSAQRVLGVPKLHDGQISAIVGTILTHRLMDLAHQKELRVCPSFADQLTYGQYLASGGDNGTLQLTIRNLPMPDATALTWPQVLEIRKDERFHTRLRDLRIYIDREFHGKDRNFIVDRLSKDLEEYEEDARKHGVRLLTACTKKLLSTGTTLSAAGLATFAAIAGPSIALAGLVGAAVPLGALLIELHEIRTNLRSEIRNPELAFLAELKKIRPPENR
jgi:hypothetical protein